MDTVAPARRAGRRPNFPLDFKRQVVEATFQPGASVSLIAREYDVNANLVFRWWRQYQEGTLAPIKQSAALLLVQVIEAPIAILRVVQSPSVCHSEIVVEVGKAKLRITGTPDSQALLLILQQLLR
ncbi:MAG: transposase [Pseudomonas sp.]|uniref:IS66-like element accessory protein TnpA n=1 Tax=Pseudomonas sp. TaxID=306 RepID=UPI002FC75C78